MFNVNMSIDNKAISLIQVRIVELENKRINTESMIREYNNKIEQNNITKNEENALFYHVRNLRSKLVEIEQVLWLNKYLLNQTNEHEYQLEN